MKASPSMRIWFALVSVILWTGIFLSGFSNVNWLVYLPAAGFALGAITGICPSLMAASKIFGIKTKTASNS
ncbi:MAG: hypothetical protein ABI416_17220 [Ginsengibacter sp.]